MRKAEFEQKYLGEKVQIELFDGDILTGFLQKLELKDLEIIRIFICVEVLLFDRNFRITGLCEFLNLSIFTCSKDKICIKKGVI